MKKILFVAILVIALASAVGAVPTRTGLTGGIALPTAQVIGSGEWEVGIDFYRLFDTNVTDAQLLYGFGSIFEAALGYTSVGGENVLSCAAKYGFPTEAKGIKFAAAAQYVNSDRSTWNLTVVGDKTFDMGENVPATASLGLNWVDFEDTASGLRVLGALNVGLTKSLSIIGEYQTKINDWEESQVKSIGLRYAATENLSLQAGWTNQCPYHPDGYEPAFIFGASYKFGQTE